MEITGLGPCHIFLHDAHLRFVPAYGYRSADGVAFRRDQVVRGLRFAAIPPLFSRPFQPIVAFQDAHAKNWMIRAASVREWVELLHWFRPANSNLRRRTKGLTLRRLGTTGAWTVVEYSPAAR